MTRVPDYRAALDRLARVDAEAAALREEAHRWHAEQCAAADAAEQAAERELRQATDDVAAAQRALEAAQVRAAELWTDYVHRAGPAAERFGRTVPEPVVPRQRDGRGADEYLGEVASRLTYQPPSRPLTSATQLLLAVLGVLGGAVGFVAGQVLRWAGRQAGGDWAVGLPVLGLIVMLLGPVAAVGAARRVADHRHVTLGAAAVAVVGAAGVITIAGLAALLR